MEEFIIKLLLELFEHIAFSGSLSSKPSSSSSSSKSRSPKSLHWESFLLYVMK